MRVINTDNFGRDYPNESFVSESIPEDEAKRIADAMNDKAGPHSDRYFRVVPDDYKLQPGFEP